MKITTLSFAREAAPGYYLHDWCSFLFILKELILKENERVKRLMKLGSRYLAKWLIVILMMAIGIGAFAVLSIRNEKEANETSQSSYLTNQTQQDIDFEELKTIIGDYQAEESFWHLFISEEYEEKGPYLSVYDNGAGNPGFEGRIMHLKDGIVIIEIDADLYEEMPAGWEPEGDGMYAILDYSVTDEGIRLGYRGNELDFVKE